MQAKQYAIISTGIDWALYEQNIVKSLQDHQPKNENPLDIYPLKDNSEFNDWLWRCMMAFSSFTQAEGIYGTIQIPYFANAYGMFLVFMQH